MRLAAEMEHRKKVAVMMREFLHVQEELLAQAERNLEVSYTTPTKKTKLFLNLQLCRRLT